MSTQKTDNEESSLPEKRVQKDWYSERRKKHLWRLFALILLAVIIYNTKTKQRWLPDLDDGTIMFERSTWWGLNNQKYYPDWRKESDASPDDVERWCIKWPDGSWHTFIWRYGDDGPVDIYFPPAHSQQADNNSQSNNIHRSEAPKEQVATLAQQYNCLVLGEEIRKAAGTNRLFTINVQRILTISKRLVATGTLNDLIQSGEKVKAVFDLNDTNAQECLMSLECPTNFISRLASEKGDWDIVFEVSTNRPIISSDESKSSLDYQTGLLIEGKLIELGAVVHNK